LTRPLKACAERKVELVGVNAPVSSPCAGCAAHLTNGAKGEGVSAKEGGS